MKDPLGVSPSKGNQGTTRGKEKILLISVGIEPTTSGLDLPLLKIKILFCPISGTEFDHFWNWFGKNKFPEALQLLK